MPIITYNGAPTVGKKARARAMRHRRNLFLAALACIVTAASLSFVVLTFASTASGPIRNANGKCLDNKGASTTDNNALQLYTCNGTRAQQWSLPGDGTIRVQDKCLMPRDGERTSNTPAVVAECTAAASQQWMTKTNGTIVNVATRLCLENRNGLATNGNPVHTSTCNTTQKQKWDLPVAVTETVAPGAQQQVKQPAAAPAPAPAPKVNNPSGQAVPKSDLPGWKHVFFDDFNKDTDPGDWGSPCDFYRVAYTGAEGQQWRSSPMCANDLYGKRPYRADQVLSVKNGLLRFHLHTVDGQPAGANPSPIINPALMDQHQLYGRYSVRLKVDNPHLREYYFAGVLWPQSERWPADGEADFPEGYLDGTVSGFHHYAGEGSCYDCQEQVREVGARFTEWHTYTIEWTPEKMTFLLDDTVVLESTKWVPQTPMRWQLQADTRGFGNNDGNLLVDWVSIYQYAP
ncbi:ricin-type beta-trefoil lectin domain protein [Candidatus Saccharibacteria bacterium]|nr:ricin-type beta-trefoil lectin domain protein [Candidatus Saccharibacteria bacterium]